jgi:uncharacterized SAM-binding protein YcdF (DUF218 family)
VIRFAGGVFNAVAFAFLLTIHAILVFAHRPLDARGIPASVPLVIVLDAGARFDLGVRLVEEGYTDWIHFSAGEGHGLARIYAERARQRLPETITITTEARSLTTLQNAYFTMEELGGIPEGAVLVTDASHLFRAWLCFRWAGSGPVHLAPATDFDFAGPWARRVLREAVAVWLTVGRIAAFTAHRLAGADPDPAILADSPLS